MDPINTKQKEVVPQNNRLNVNCVTLFYQFVFVYSTFDTGSYKLFLLQAKTIIYLIEDNIPGGNYRTIELIILQHLSICFACFVTI